MLDNDSTLFTALISLVIFLWFIFSYLKCPKNLPPGPKGLPYFGYLPFLGSQPHVSLMELTKKYGDMFSINIIGERVIVLSSFKLIKELLQKQGFEERPPSFRQIVIMAPEAGLFGGTGASRVELRRFVLTTLRNFGMGKASLEPKIQDEIHYLIEEIRKHEGKPSDIHSLLTMSISNVLVSNLFGKRMNYTDVDFQQLLQSCKLYIKSLGIDQWTNHLPFFLTKLFGIKTPMDYGFMFYQNILKLLKKYNENSTRSCANADNFIEVWRAESEKSIANQTFFSEAKLSQVLWELCIGASDTTSVTLNWALLYLIKHPDVQEKVQKEIDNVIGKNRTPTMSDQKLMPYTEATIAEVARITTIVPLNTPRSSSEETTFNGYFIPKNTTFYTNLWALHKNPEIFPEPEKFMPERFLADDNKMKRMEELMPFSLGKRQCVGEALARMQLFLYLTSLLQHFTFSKPDSVILDCEYSIIIAPKPQNICAKLRM